MAPLIWTGSEMIAWGGAAGADAYGDGFAYDPSSDAWRELSATLAPLRRNGHTSVWTGALMMIWGGYCVDEGEGQRSGSECNNGARYDPALDQWTVMAPSKYAPLQSDHHAVWAGSEMITLGGCAGDPGICDVWSGIYTP